MHFWCKKFSAELSNYVLPHNKSLTFTIAILKVTYINNILLVNHVNHFTQSVYQNYL